MKNKRRDFLKLTGIAGIGIAGNMFKGFAVPTENHLNSNLLVSSINPVDEKDLSIIGLYGPWATALNDNKLPAFSFRRKEWSKLEAWRRAAKRRLIERLAIPDIGGTPNPNVIKQYIYDGLYIEELSWQLPYGRPTEAILLKPLNAKGRLPAILAFHDHGGRKSFSIRKITRTSDYQHPIIEGHQKHLYDGLAWANEIAKRGYVVLVSDAFPFGSRRVMMQDVPEQMREGLNDIDPENSGNIDRYDDWARAHEHIMARSLFSAGTTWPAISFAEDQKALDVLCARADVDANRIGCGGLSLGGMRTVFMGGLDPRIKCAVCVGFMTTWKDLVLSKLHTWATYVPLLPNELNFPEILGLRAPLPALVLNDEDDDLYTPPEMKEAQKILTEVYKKAGAENNFKCSYYPGPHKFDKKMQGEAFDWFDKWLNSAAPKGS